MSRLRLTDRRQWRLPELEMVLELLRGVGRFSSGYEVAVYKPLHVAKHKQRKEQEIISAPRRFANE